jgi:hypothetical protein
MTMSDAPQTETVAIALDGGATVPFELATHGDAPLFALGVRKSGSSVFSNVCAAIAKANGVNVVDVPGVMFDRGHTFREWNESPRLPAVVKPGNMYIGFRDAPTGLYDHPAFRAGRKILLVRDPRDALVSEYFSNAYSHSLPQVNADASTIAVERRKALETSVDQYVSERVGFLDATVTAYEPLLDDPNLMVMRYEDVILKKADWVRDIARHFGLVADERLVAGILGWADVKPQGEDPTKFIRRVTPGDHLEKLRPDTIAAINAGLSPVWARLGYTL